eukprot:CAMPEP_0185689528 /NCGR_PEP_ID=MMETSP1164-20130828/511_1 /TAXON_ID=1104430 /ORGANISM="Chrysoreinhardia sp, Strain CCMP2950" /LENGTH=43 /DNA_ID= /DNA_START= /DNA_END= /DNA_ORIENTATION=
MYQVGVGPQPRQQPPTQALVPYQPQQGFQPAAGPNMPNIGRFA